MSKSVLFFDHIRFSFADLASQKIHLFPSCRSSGYSTKTSRCLGRLGDVARDWHESLSQLSSRARIIGARVRDAIWRERRHRELERVFQKVDPRAGHRRVPNGHTRGLTPCPPLQRVPAARRLDPQHEGGSCVATNRTAPANGLAHHPSGHECLEAQARGLVELGQSMNHLNPGQGHGATGLAQHFVTRVQETPGALRATGQC